MELASRLPLVPEKNAKAAGTPRPLDMPPPVSGKVHSFATISSIFSMLACADGGGADDMSIAEAAGVSAR